MLKILIFIVCSSVPLASHGSPPASFAYVLQAGSLEKSKAQCIRRLAASGRDWVVLDVLYGADEPWSRADLDAIRQGRPGRKVLAYLSIGEAEDYRAYWRPEWGARKKLTVHAPAWLGAENPDWEGNYRVRYWHPEWQAIMLSAVDDAMTQGFDGVYLDIVDGFETFEQEGGEYRDHRVNPETKQSYRRDMVDWVKAVAARARAKNSAALVIPQNGTQLLADKEFVGTISALGIEDLFTNGNKLQSTGHTAEVLGNLQKLTGTGKPILLVEYPRAANLRELVQQGAQEHGLVWLLTDRPLKTLGQSGSGGKKR